MKILLWIVVFLIVAGGVVYLILRNRSIEVGKAIDRIKGSGSKEKTEK